MAGAAKTLDKEVPETAILSMTLDGLMADTKEQALEGARRIATRAGLPFPTLVWLGPTEPLTEMMGIMGTPYNVFLSADGKVLGVMEIDAEREKVIEDIQKAFKIALERLKSGAGDLAKNPASNPAPAAPLEPEKK